MVNIEATLAQLEPVGSNKEFWVKEVEQRNFDPVKRDWFIRVIGCESTWNAQAKNKYSDASGLIQFMPSTYRYYGGVDIWSGKEQIAIASKMYDKGQQKQWSCK